MTTPAPVPAETPPAAPAGGEPRNSSLAPGLLVLLATGAVDAYTFLRHGHVFAEAMTGNLVLVAVGVARPGIVSFWRPLAAFAAFGLGVLAASHAAQSAVAHRRPRALRTATIIVEIVVLGVVGALPAGAPQWLIVVAIAFTSGMQIDAFRRIEGTDVTATVMTTNAMRAIEAARAALASRRARDVRAALTLAAGVSMFAAGAFLGAGSCLLLGDRAAWVAAGLFAVVLGLVWDRAG